MGRALSNTMINLGIQGECDEAIYQVSWLNQIVKILLSWGRLSKGWIKLSTQ